MVHIYVASTCHGMAFESVMMKYLHIECNFLSLNALVPILLNISRAMWDERGSGGFITTVCSHVLALLLAWLTGG